MDTNEQRCIQAPVIILSAPRAGSTLLFETLAKHPFLWTIGDESHALIEHIPQLSTVSRGYVSNCLDEMDASEEMVDLLHQRFSQSARDIKGNIYKPAQGNFRLLEKTPKNALRVEFLNRAFPDAKFIYLVRDPRENVSSIMEAWDSGRFTTYPNLPNWRGGWSLLLPKGWRNYIGKPLSSIARYQWQQANDSILNGLATITSSRKMILNYQDFVSEPAKQLEKLLEFAELDPQYINKMLAGGLDYSRYTLTRPKKGKWLSHAKKIAPEMHYINDTVNNINRWLSSEGCSSLDSTINLADVDSLVSTEVKHSLDVTRTPRNATCPCGSGKRFKLCHGLLK
ncbi:sulfotransferase [Paraglaciecola sp.]|uniref:sulfotransferase n=1 Tax=Paraglaciecola sp. TaxID=1920173 RepID=UPI003265734A